MNNDPYLVIANSAKIVIDNSNANAITQTGTGGRIISEAETNVVRWNVSGAIGTYTVPFFDNDNALEIPLTVAIVTGGSLGASNHIDFSTYNGPSFDNSSYMPSGVSNMGSSSVPTANNSDKVIDRFWILDANHTVKPSITLSLTYIDAEWSASGNTIIEDNLRAQRWNTSLGDWDQFGFSPAGIADTATNIVSGITVPSADFYRSWTLVDYLAPLPIELLSNEVYCNNNNVVIKWTTASETNNDFFTIEKSIDAINFTAIGTVGGAGNSTTVLNYSFSDLNPYSGIAYYRLKQTDYDGMSETFSILASQNCNTSFQVNVNAFNDQSGSIVILIDTDVSANYTATLFDALGKKICSKDLNATEGNNIYKLGIASINSGVYFISIDNGKEITIKKILVLH